MKHIGAQLKRNLKRTRETERGELMKYFCERINPSRKEDGLVPLTMARMGKLLEKIPTKDLYYIKSVCDTSMHFSKKFWYLLNPDKYTKAGENKLGKGTKMK
jgi:hypothetical protein